MLNYTGLVEVGEDAKMTQEMFGYRLVKKLFIELRTDSSSANVAAI